MYMAYLFTFLDLLVQGSYPFGSQVSAEKLPGESRSA